MGFDLAYIPLAAHGRADWDKSPVEFPEIPMAGMPASFLDGISRATIQIQYLNNIQTSHSSVFRPIRSR
jgi:hypothetical protein